MPDDSRYPCPCCGYLVLDGEPPGTELVCPICAWWDVEDVARRALDQHWHRYEPE